VKKVLAILLVVVVMALGFGAPALAADLTANLITDGGDNPTDIGDLSVTYDSVSGNFTAAYNIDSPWEIVETHVYIGSQPPAKSSPGRFPYMAGDIPFDVTGLTKVYIAAHAEVRMDTGLLDDLGNPIYAYESVWAQTGTDFAIGKGANWATYFEFTLP
jgi:hypothetical protein